MGVNHEPSPRRSQRRTTSLFRLGMHPCAVMITRLKIDSLVHNEYQYSSHVAWGTMEQKLPILAPDLPPLTRPVSCMKEGLRRPPFCLMELPYKFIGYHSS